MELFPSFRCEGAQLNLFRRVWRPCARYDKAPGVRLESVKVHKNKDAAETPPQWSLQELRKAEAQEEEEESNYWEIYAWYPTPGK